MSRATAWAVARLRAIKTDIVENLARSNLSIGEVAARHGLTPRYVQMLFESEGATFTEFLLDQRLAQTYRMLTDVRFAERSVTSVAFDAGQFRNLRLRGLSKRKPRRGGHVAYLAPAHSSKSGSPLAPHSRQNGNGLLYVTSPS